MKTDELTAGAAGGQGAAETGPEGRRTAPRSCPTCGRAFTRPADEGGFARYCSPACRRTAARARRRYRQGRGASALALATMRGVQRRRVLTPLTPYLVQKWALEGMDTAMIGSILQMPAEQVEEAMRTELSAQERLAMVQYLAPSDWRGRWHEGEDI